jgi:hypothetical protein
MPTSTSLNIISTSVPSSEGITFLQIFGFKNIKNIAPNFITFKKNLNLSSVTKATDVSCYVENKPGERVPIEQKVLQKVYIKGAIRIATKERVSWITPLEEEEFPPGGSAGQYLYLGIIGEKYQ